MAKKEHSIPKAKPGTEYAAGTKSKAKASQATGKASGCPVIPKGDKGHIKGKMR